MKLIVGLGNPGKEYEKTRHNVGFMLVSELCGGEFSTNKKLKSLIKKNENVCFIQPQTYMNNSGEAASKAAAYYNVDIEDILVIHDDLDITLGKYKFEKSRGPKIHNGVNSINQQLGSEDYFRLRVGVDSRTEEQRKIPGSKYVLAKLSKEEQGVLNQVFAEMKKDITEWVNG